jgi:hypothetical protein
MSSLAAQSGAVIDQIRTTLETIADRLATANRRDTSVIQMPLGET